MSLLYKMFSCNEKKNLYIYTSSKDGATLICFWSHVSGYLMNTSQMFTLLLVHFCSPKQKLATQNVCEHACRLEARTWYDWQITDHNNVFSEFRTNTNEVSKAVHCILILLTMCKFDFSFDKCTDSNRHIAKKSLNFIWRVLG